MKAVCVCIYIYRCTHARTHAHTLKRGSVGSVAGNGDWAKLVFVRENQNLFLDKALVLAFQVARDKG